MLLQLFPQESNRSHLLCKRVKHTHTNSNCVESFEGEFQLSLPKMFKNDKLLQMGMNWKVFLP